MVRHGGFICQRLGSYFDVLVPFWFHVGSSLSILVPAFEFWFHFGSQAGPSRAQAGPRRAQAGPKLGPSWAQAGPKLGPSRAQAGPKPGPSWAPAGPKPGLRSGHFQNPFFFCVNLKNGTRPFSKISNFQDFIFQPFRKCSY